MPTALICKKVTDPFTVQGRCPQVKSLFVAMVKKEEDGNILICLDDHLNPGFWAEVTLKPAEIIPLLGMRP
jgi:hypothetical protein